MNQTLIPELSTIDLSATSLTCLTIHEPWASAILLGPKRIENRTWRTSYRGVLGIHAGRSRASITAGNRMLKAVGYTPGEPRYGILLGIVELVDIVRVSDCDGDPFASGPQCWKLARPRLFNRPLIFSGQQGLWIASLPCTLNQLLTEVPHADPRSHQGIPPCEGRHAQTQSAQLA